MEKAAAQRTKERGGEPVPALPSNLKIQNRKMGRVRDDPGQMGAVYLVHAHVEQRQAQVLRPHADSQQVLLAPPLEGSLVWQ